MMSKIYWQFGKIGVTLFGDDNRVANTSWVLF